MGKNKVEITGINTNNLKRLSQSEMTELFKKLREGDVSAKDELIEGNLRLVLSILKKFYNKSDNMDDLFQIGCVGLVKAVDNFDLAQNVKFSTYAVLMIEGEIRRYIRDNTPMRVSRGIKDLAYLILKYKEEYIYENGCEPTSKEISEHFKISEFRVYQAMMSLKEPMSIFEPIYNDGGDTIYLLDQIEDKKENKEIDNLIIMRKALQNIRERDRSILVDRFIMGKTQVEIADEIGISQAQVSRLEKNAIKKMKRFIK